MAVPSPGVLESAAGSSVSGLEMGKERDQAREVLMG